MWNIGSFSFERLHAPVRGGRARLREVKFSFARQKREPEKHQLRALVARGWFFLLVKWLALRAGQR